MSRAQGAGAALLALCAAPMVGCAAPEQGTPTKLSAGGSVKLPSVECPERSPLGYKEIEGNKIAFWCADAARREWLIGTAWSGGGMISELRYRLMTPVEPSPREVWTGTLQRIDGDRTTVEFKDGEPWRCLSEGRAWKPSGGWEGYELREERLWKDGHVRLVRRFSRGQLGSEEEIDAKGLHDGLLRAFWATGAPRTESFYKHGGLHGSHTSYRQDGTKIRTSEWSEGRQHGADTTWDANGQKRSSGWFEGGVPHGDFTVWNSSGEVTDQLHLDHGNGPFVSVDDEGRVARRGYYRAGAWDGSFTDYHPSGQPRARGGLLDGRLHGSWQSYWESGQVKLRGRYLAGAAYGVWEMLHADGSLAVRGEVRSLGAESVKQGLWQVWPPGAAPDAPPEREERFDSGLQISPAPVGDTCSRERFVVTEAGDLGRDAAAVACPPKLRIAQ